MDTVALAATRTHRLAAVVVAVAGTATAATTRETMLQCENLHSIFHVDRKVNALHRIGEIETVHTTTKLKKEIGVKYVSERRR